MNVIQFPLPTTHRGLLMFIGLANYFRDHAPNMIEMMKPLRDMITVGKGEEQIAAFNACQLAVSNFQQL